MSINHKYVFDAANDLRIGSEILNSKFGETVFPVRSTIVTAAFSTELYLKCLLFVSGKDIPRGRQGHNLKILYKALGSGLQQKINKKFKAANQGSQTILDIMDDFKNTFTEWRYIYEKQDTEFFLNYKPLYELVQVLDKTVREMKPEWN